VIRTQEIPASDCAFALLDPPVGTGRDARRELMFQLEAVLPQPLESMHAVFEPVDGKVIACACDRVRVAEFRATTDRLVPDLIPAWTGVENSEHIHARLNLLSGDMRPLSSIALTRGTSILVCVCSIVMLFVIFIGVSRRLSTIEEQQVSLNNEIAAAYGSVLPRSSKPGVQPDAVRFSTMLNQARSTRTGATGTDRVDLVSDLSQLLNNWPQIEDLQVQSLSIQPGTARLLMSTPDNETSTAVMEALIALPGWESASRNTTPRADRVEISAVLAQIEGGDQE